VYRASGKQVIFDERVTATCDVAEKAVKLLNDARYLNNIKRKYTAAARKIAEAETLPGFKWVEEDATTGH
jgi:hypothetical protein